MQIQPFQNLYSHLNKDDPKLFIAMALIDNALVSLSNTVENLSSSDLISMTPPGNSTSSGERGQLAVDNKGNLYFCYVSNKWARIGPDGYSNSF